jgi:hypothetical protein
MNGRVLVAIGCAIVAVAIAGSYADSRRADEADGAIRVLERETAAAQKQRHAQSIAAIAAKQELARARVHADSLEAAARRAAVESARLAQLVHIASETTLVATVASGETINVTVPRVVTSYIWSLYRTIQAQEAALAARDLQAVRADTVIVYQDRVVQADSTVITTQAETVTEEKAARPRFGFKSGLAAGAALVALIAHLVR